MSPLLAIAGTGTMGRSAGLYFLGRGWRVTWFSRDAGRVETARARLARDLRKMSLAVPGTRLPEARVLLVGDSPENAPTLALECVEERLETKREALANLRRLAGERTLLASGTSSILPSELGEGVSVLHFFHPVELTQTVEAIYPADYPETPRRRAWTMLADAGLAVVEEEEESAFAANRLLLPLQRACLDLLREGWPAAVVDEMSGLGILPVGQLAFLDGVGLDVACAAAGNYVRRMPASEGAGYAGLIEGLERLVAMGKRGRKNRDGFLSGSPLPWPAKTDTEGPPGVERVLREIFVGSCRRFVERGELSAPDLDVILGNVFGVAGGLAAISTGDGAAV